jgi:hypothetical protein
MPATKMLKKKVSKSMEISCTIVKHCIDTYQANKNACADSNRQLVYRVFAFFYFEIDFKVELVQASS